MPVTEFKFVLSLYVWIVANNKYSLVTMKPLMNQSLENTLLSNWWHFLVILGFTPSAHWTFYVPHCTVVMKIL